MKFIKHLAMVFLEKVYENALLIELKLKSISTESQYPIDVFYKDENVGECRADILVDKKIIVE